MVVAMARGGGGAILATISREVNSFVLSMRK